MGWQTNRAEIYIYPVSERMFRWFTDPSVWRRRMKHVDEARERFRQTRMYSWPCGCLFLFIFRFFFFALTFGYKTLNQRMNAEAQHYLNHFVTSRADLLWIESRACSVPRVHTFTSAERKYYNASFPKAIVFRFLKRGDINECTEV